MKLFNMKEGFVLYNKSHMEMSFREKTGIISKMRATAKRFEAESKTE